jgi:cell division transport system permease protein
MSQPPPPHQIADLRTGPLLPARDGRDRALTFVITVLCALASLTVLGGAAASRAASGWDADLRASATIQVQPRPGETSAEAAGRAAEAVAGVKGVVEARALDRAAAVKLLEPWLGKGGVPDDLPIPELVTVDLDPVHPASGAALTAALSEAGVDGVVDDHRRWLGDLERTAFAAQMAALGAAALLASAAAATIAFATRAGLQARRDVVEVLHLSGAQDRFIAALFQRRFAALAGWSGLQGAVLASAVWVGLKLLAPGDDFSPILPQRWDDLWLAAPCPVLAAAIGGISARASALSMLKAGYAAERGFGRRSGAVR